MLSSQFREARLLQSVNVNENTLWEVADLQNLARKCSPRGQAPVQSELPTAASKDRSVQGCASQIAVLFLGTLQEHNIVNAEKASPRLP